MSNLVFPLALAGLAAQVTRTLVASTAVQTTLSGRELRSTWSLYPRYKYTVAFDFLRSASQAELQQIFTFVARHAGQLDSFLFADPEDSSVTDFGFGVGDGSTTTFQLQRALTGLKPDGFGTWQNGTKPRTNMLKWSQDLSQSSVWANLVSGTGSAAIITANYALAPDGTPTATRVRLDKGAGTTNTDYCRMSQYAQVVAGSVYMFSVWLKSADGSTYSVAVETASGTGGYQVVTVTGTWQRFQGTVWLSSMTGASTALVSLRGSYVPATSQAADLLVWGAQFEQLPAGQTTPSQYIPTGSAAATANPAYWPSLGDGFEPVFDLNGPLSVYLDGDWQGRRQLYQTARTNLILYSSQVDNAVWIRGSGIASVTANAGTAPDGTATADKLTETSDGSANGSHYVGQGPASLAANTRYIKSVYVKLGGGTVRQAELQMRRQDGVWATVCFDLSTAAGSVVNPTAGVAAAGILPLASGWYRVWMAMDSGSGATPNNEAILMAMAGGASYQGDGTGTMLVWGAQTEAVPAGATTPTGLIQTTSAAVTVTDYTLGSQGQVTLATPPAAGAVLSWTGSYFRRCRFAADELGADRIVNQMWKTGSVELLSVKP